MDCAWARRQNRICATREASLNSKEQAKASQQQAREHQAPERNEGTCRRASNSIDGTGMVYAKCGTRGITGQSRDLGRPVEPGRRPPLINSACEGPESQDALLENMAKCLRRKAENRTVRARPMPGSLKLHIAWKLHITKTFSGQPSTTSFLPSLSSRILFAFFPLPPVRWQLTKWRYRHSGNTENPQRRPRVVPGWDGKERGGHRWGY